MEAKNIYELIEERQSDRKFDPDYEIDPAILDRMLSAVRLSPSACNAQPWKFVVVCQADHRASLVKALTSTLVPGINKFAKDASAFVVVVKEPVNFSSKAGTFMKGTDFSSYDIGIATGFLTLAAEHEGLGSCIIGWLDKKKIRALLNIPEKKDIPLVIALGKSLSKQRSKSRKAMDTICSYEQYE